MNILGTLFGGIPGLLLKMFTGPVLSFVSNIVGKLSDEHVAIVQAQTGLTAAQTTAVVGAEIARQNVVGNVMVTMMNHPIWWVGWALFVLPVGFYDALIHIKSLACPFDVAACAWNIPRVPATQEDWDKMVVLSFFGIFGASTVVSAIVSKMGK